MPTSLGGVGYDFLDWRQVKGFPFPHLVKASYDRVAGLLLAVLQHPRQGGGERTGFSRYKSESAICTQGESE